MKKISVVGKKGRFGFSLPQCFGGVNGSACEETVDCGAKNGVHPSERALYLSQKGENPYSLGWSEQEKNPYNLETNQTGIINLAMAENRLTLDLLAGWAEDANFNRLIAKESNPIESIVGYREFHGIPEFRKTMAKVMSTVMRNAFVFDAENLVITCGASAAVELITFCLTDPGDSIIVPIPSYPGFDKDVEWRMGAKLVPAITRSSDEFIPSYQCLEEAWQRSRSLGLRPRAVLISNPSNPVGFTYDKEILAMFLSFVKEKDMHLISDEIYAGCVYEEPNFSSVVRVLHKPEDFDRVHIIYGLAKDFAIPGLRTGVLCTWNTRVLSAAKKISRVTSLSNQTQLSLTNLLSDDDFVATLLEENRKRLRAARKKVESKLLNLGIRFARGNGGQFIFMDLSCLLKSLDEVGESELYRSLVLEAKLNLNPGQESHCRDLGWYRLCFAMVTAVELEIALGRLEAFVLKRLGGRLNGPQ